MPPSAFSIASGPAEGTSRTLKLSSRRTAKKAAADSEARTKPGIPPLIRRNTIYIALVQALQSSAAQLAITLGALMVVRLLGSASLAGIGIHFEPRRRRVDKHLFYFRQGLG